MHLLSLSLVFGAAQALLVPSPPGPYAVAVKNIELVDPSRIDPFAPEPNIKRRFMTSAYLPVDSIYGCEQYVEPYMPPLTASVFDEVGVSLGLPHGIVEAFEMEYCNISTVNLDATHRGRKNEYPVAVFSPGFGGSRLVYGALARSLASLGYIVITVDPTYEAAVVEFPDGSAAWAQPSAASDPALTERELEVRSGDISFLISQLSNTTITKPLFSNFPATFDSHRIAVYGHSFGGSTAAETALRDPRVIGGINIDGPAYGAVGKKGIKDKPFVLLANGGEAVVDFDEFYKKIDAPKMSLIMKDTQHYAFTDVPLLLTMYHVPPASQDMVDQVFGTLDGRKVETALNEVSVGMLDLLFNNTTKSLQDVGKNPDIDVLESNLRKCR